jgi:hypothetical protein
MFNGKARTGLLVLAVTAFGGLLTIPIDKTLGMAAIFLAAISLGNAFLAAGLREHGASRKRDSASNS